MKLKSLTSTALLGFAVIFPFTNNSLAGYSITGNIECDLDVVYDHGYYEEVDFFNIDIEIYKLNDNYYVDGYATNLVTDDYEHFNLPANLSKTSKKSVLTYEYIDIDNDLVSNKFTYPKHGGNAQYYSQVNHGSWVNMLADSFFDLYGPDVYYSGQCYYTP